MDPNWYLVIALWGLILGVMLFLSIREQRKTPEQKQAERERKTTCHHTKQPKTHASSGGRLQHTIATWILCAIVFVVFLVTICLIISTN